MKSDWFQFCRLTPEQRNQANLGLSRLEEAAGGGAIDYISNWDILEAAGLVLSRIRTRWAQKILYIWANYYDFVDENPDEDGCDLQWFTPGEPLGLWPEAPDYPASFDELFEGFVTSEWFGAQRTRLNVRSILRTLAHILEEVSPRRHSVDDLIRLSGQKWRQIEGVVEYDYRPRTADLYLNIYRNLFRYIQSQGWRDSLPFEEVERGSTQIGFSRAVNEFWGALIESSPALNEALGTEQLLAIEQAPDSTEQKMALLRTWLGQLPRYDVIDALIILLELPSPHGAPLGFRKIRSIIDQILTLE